MPLRLGNINLFVPDVAAATGFFAAGLGLAADPRRSHPPDFALIDLGPSTLTLQGPSTPGYVSGGLASFELGLESDDPTDLTTFRDRLVAAGAVVEAPRSMGWGDAVDATTPDGLRLTIFRRKAESRATER